jgi:hypothetical protein
LKRIVALGVRASDGLLNTTTPVADDVEIRVSGRGNPVRTAMFQKLEFGAVRGFAPICCDANDPQTQVCGLQNRLCRQMPEPEIFSIEALKQFVKQRVVELFQPLDSIMSYEEWEASTMYPEHRKAELRLARLRSNGWPSKRSRSEITCFQKRECYEAFKPPRSINSRSDEFKVLVGPIFKSIENVVYSNPSFVKHVPVNERPALIQSYIKQDGARYIATDYSCFENLQPEIMDAIEMVLYDHMLQKFPKYAQLIRQTLLGENAAKLKCGVSFRMHGRRMSGEMCTSLGNGITNLMVFEFLMQGRNARIIVEGDDGLAGIYDEGPLPTARDYAKLGFLIKLEHIEDPMLASFCGCICPGGVIVKSPTRILAKFGWTKNVGVGRRVSNQLLRAKAMSLAYEAPHCPILRAVADRAMYLTRNYKARWDDFDNYHRELLPRSESSIPVANIPMEARIYYQDQFGISILNQLVIEKRIRNSMDLDWLQEYLPANYSMLTYESLFIQVT